MLSRPPVIRDTSFAQHPKNYFVLCVSDCAKYLCFIHVYECARPLIEGSSL